MKNLINFMQIIYSHNVNTKSKNLCFWHWEMDYSYIGTLTDWMETKNNLDYNLVVYCIQYRDCISVRICLRNNHCTNVD